MKIRSLTELIEFLSREAAWRKRELTTIRMLTLDKSRTHEQAIMLRSSVCILYAHWEGFVKNSATAYLNYASLKGLRYCDLTPSLVALGLRSKLRAAEQTNRMTVHTEVTAFLLSGMRENATLPWSDAIRTAGNLDPDVLQDISKLLALQYTPYETKKVLLNEKLLGRRNTIAHGGWLQLEVPDCDEIHFEVIDLIDLFRDNIANAASMKAFARN